MRTAGYILLILSLTIGWVFLGLNLLVALLAIVMIVCGEPKTQTVIHHYHHGDETCDD